MPILPNLSLELLQMYLDLLWFDIKKKLNTRFLLLLDQDRWRACDKKADTIQPITSIKASLIDELMEERYENKIPDDPYLNNPSTIQFSDIKITYQGTSYDGDKLRPDQVK